MEMERKRNNPDLFVVLVALKDDGIPDFYVFQHDVLSERVAREYREYAAEPKRNGEPRKDPGFRWYESSSLTTDGDRKNDWNIVTEKLT